MKRADEFTQPVRELLARRVGYRCSNPNCRLLTSGPGDDNGTVNAGVAAHITAASKGGPRYEERLTSQQRQSSENGIWLCQIHAKVVDDAPERFTVEVLQEWKRIAEEAARVEIEEIDKQLPARIADDIAALKFYASAFDRSAFKDEFRCEMSMTAFGQAIRDTVVALSTGTLRDRDGRILAAAKGRSALENRSWRLQIGAVIDLLNAIVRRYEVAVEAGDISVHNQGREIETYCIHDPELLSWIDQTRVEALGLMAKLLADAGLDPIRQVRLRRYK